jgi:hypothetical protein
MSGKMGLSRFCGNNDEVVKIMFHGADSSVVTCVVVICLIGGTSYDFYLEYNEKRKKLLVLSQTHLKLDMSMPDTKTKSGVYIVNNNNVANGHIDETESNRNSRPRTLNAIISKKRLTSQLFVMFELF